MNRTNRDAGEMDRTQELTDPNQRGAVREVIILRNPNAGQGRRLRDEPIEKLCTALRAQGFQPQVLHELALLRQMVAEAEADGRLGAVVAAGGDGTAEAVVERVSPQTPVALFPLGTENLLAKYLGLRADGPSCARLIARGRRVMLDAGHVRLADGSQRTFLIMLGCGFDADVIHRLHQVRRGPISHWSYAGPIVRSICHYRYPSLRVVQLDVERRPLGGPIVGHFAFVFNVPSYAAQLPFCPQAEPTDGKLNLLTFDGGTFWKGLAHFISIVLRRHHQNPRVQFLEATHLRIEADGPLPVQMDGDPGGYLPIEVEIVPQRWTAIAP